MTKLEQELLKTISGQLRRGDIKTIAEKTGYTREYVGMVLNGERDLYNQNIVDAAVTLISTRNKGVSRQLEQIS